MRRKRPAPAPARLDRPQYKDPLPLRTEFFQGRGWSGQPLTDRPAEEARQRWVYDQVKDRNRNIEVIRDMEAEFYGGDPVAEYERHRRNYELTGDMEELRRALNYVIEP